MRLIVVGASRRARALISNTLAARTAAITLIGLSACARCGAGSISVYRTTAANVPLIVMSVDMNDPHVKVTGMVARGGCGNSEQFSDMIHRSHPTAAVTGTFFSTDSLAPIGDIVVDGRLAHRGGVGTGLCITDSNQCDFVQPPHRYAFMDWSLYDFVCASGPRLLQNGVTGVYPHQEGFRDPHLLHSATRLAVGLRADNRLLFVATRTRVQLGAIGRAMLKLGCRNAIALDAGSSLGFYHDSKVLIAPKRRLTNLILIYDDRDRYARFKYRLTPARAIASSN